MKTKIKTAIAAVLLSASLSANAATVELSEAVSLTVWSTVIGCVAGAGGAPVVAIAFPAVAITVMVYRSLEGEPENDGQEETNSKA